MFADQLYLLACLFASRADSENLIRVLHHVEYSMKFVKIVCILWPELSDPLSLRFLFNHQKDAQVKPMTDEELVVSLLEKDSMLIPMVEINNETVSNRRQQLEQFINSKWDSLTSINDIDTSSSSSSISWLSKRILLCNDSYPGDVFFYEPLWNLLIKDGVVSEKDRLFQWIKGIIIPLHSISIRTHAMTKIIDFEKMNATVTFPLILDGKIFHELIPYLDFTNLSNEFIENYFTNENFLLATVQNYDIFRNIFFAFSNETSKSNFDKVCGNVANILFENSSNLLNFKSLEELKNILNRIPKDTPIAKYDITVADVTEYIRYMEVMLSNYSLKEVYTISQEEESAQLAHFASSCKEELMAALNNNEESTLSQKLNSLYTLSNASSSVFNRLSTKIQQSILLETVLDMGQFDILHEFMSEYGSNLETDLLEKYFWKFFNNATNGSCKRAEMIKSQKTLNLLLKQDAKKYERLQSLLDVADEISRYSMNLGRGIIFKPSNILDFQEDPYQLISTLLELNSSLYKDCLLYTSRCV